jgi:hypothetical protein
MMPATTTPGRSPEFLHRRLAHARHRLRLITTFRGLCWLLALVCALAALGGVGDWLLHLPALVRAIFLVNSLTCAGLILYFLLYRPLAVKTDDLSLALRVEQQYPALNDGLASTVQFLEQDESSGDSESLRRMAVKVALRQAEACDFNRIINKRGVLTGALSMIVLGGAAVTLSLLFPTQAWTALGRLTNPFGGREWPRQTQLEILDGRTRIGRNEAFDVRGLVCGVVPATATVVYRLDNRTQIEQTCEIVPGEEPNTGTLSTKLEAGRVQKSFSFQVRANDAVSEWRSVAVVAPPALASLDGRASPQVRLRPPPYTDQPDEQLADGMGNVEGVVGTRVALRAAADRPLRAAWIQFVPQTHFADLAAFLGPLGNPHPIGDAAQTVAGEAVFGNVPAKLERGGEVFSVEFLPWVAGTYVLHIEDDTGLHNSRVFELHVNADPAPSVTLVRPSASRDNLSLLPGADFSFEALVSDPVYAVRSAYLEYRCDKHDPPRRIPLYDFQAAEQVAAGLGAPHAKQQQLHFTRRFSLAEFKHLDPARSPLRAGDVLTLQVCADDFDDVTVSKEPGRSHEVEILVISRTELDKQLSDAQAKLEQELVLAREQQRDAIKKVAEADKQLRRNGKLTRDQAEALLQAEQTQQQLRDKIGEDEQKGMRGEVERIQQTLRDNHLPRTATHERIDKLADELQRLARDELTQIEPRLTEARKLNDQVEKKPELLQEEAKKLTEARQHQDEVEKTLTDLLQRLEPWSSAREIKGETQEILKEQERLKLETEELKNRGLLGKDDAKLTEKEREELKQLAADQQKLTERMNQLLNKMDSVAKERAKKNDAQTAAELKSAHEQAIKDGLPDSMEKAREQIANNQLNKASDSQKESIDKLQKLVKTLEDKRSAELKRTADELRKKEKELEKLLDDQEKLSKKVKDAGNIRDAKQREEELKRLAREQQALKDRADELLKQLSRMREAGRAAQDLARAAEHMQQSADRLSRGQKSDDDQEETLDRLNDAADELQQAREETEEQLAREQLAKIAELLTLLKVRHEALIAVAARIQKELSQAPRDERRALLRSLGDLGENQEALAGDVARLADERLAEARVFANLLKKAAEAMRLAASSFKEHRESVVNTGEVESPARAEAIRQQKEALRRFEQLLDALKPEAGVALKPPQKNDGSGGGGGGGGREGDDIPPLVQLKLLRAMQASLNENTEKISREHPDATKLNDAQKNELRKLQREQQEIAELLDEFIHPPEGPMKESKLHRLVPGVLAGAFVSAGLAFAAEPPKDGPDDPPRLQKKHKPPQDQPSAKPDKPKDDPDKPKKDDEQKDQPDAGAGDPEMNEQETLNRIDRNLKSVQDRLANKDLGDGTRLMQRDILKDFDTLIEQQKNQNQQQSSADQSSSSSASSSKSKNSSGSKSSSKSQGRKGRQTAKNSSGSGGQNQKPGSDPQPGPGDRPKESTAKNGNGNQGGGGGTSEQRPDLDKLAEIYKDVWGQLPEKIRAEMNEYSREELMERYPDLVKQFRVTISKKGARKEGDR